MFDGFWRNVLLFEPTLNFWPKPLCIRFFSIGHFVCIWRFVWIRCFGEINAYLHSNGMNPLFTCDSCTNVADTENLEKTTEIIGDGRRLKPLRYEIKHEIYMEIVDRILLLYEMISEVFSWYWGRYFVYFSIHLNESTLDRSDRSRWTDLGKSEIFTKFQPKLDDQKNDKHYTRQCNLSSFQIVLLRTWITCS